MIAISVQSGSNGNCIYVEAAGTRLLFDAGISGLQVERRLEALGRRVHDVDAVVISHDHSDHIRCAGVFQRKFGLPIYVTAPTLQAASGSQSLGTLHDVRYFEAGQSIAIGAVEIESIRTPHDAADGAAFVVAAGGRRLGIMTDLGHVFGELPGALATLDAVFIESNYDPEMLASGPYPYALQERIRGPHGHLSNFEAALLLRDAAAPRLRWACLAHLSEHNNLPDLAMQTHRDILPDGFPLVLASRYQAGPVLEV